VLSSYLEFWTLDEVHKHSGSDLSSSFFSSLLLSSTLSPEFRRVMLLRTVPCRSSLSRTSETISRLYSYQFHWDNSVALLQDRSCVVTQEALIVVWQLHCAPHGAVESRVALCVRGFSIRTQEALSREIQLTHLSL
jgi:hypothetical protein